MSQPFSSSGPQQGPHTPESRAGVPRPPAASAAGPQPFVPLDDILQIDDDADPGIPSPRLPATLVSWPDRLPAPHGAAPPAGAEDDLLEVVPEPEDAMLEVIPAAEDEAPEAVPASDLSADGPCPAPRLDRPPRGRRLAKNDPPAVPNLTPQQRLLLLDVWNKSGLPGQDFAALVGLSKYTLYAWKKKFEQFGPAGLLDQPRGRPEDSALPNLTRRTILRRKRHHPDWGCPKLRDLRLRGPALPASPGAVARGLHEAGYQRAEVPTRPHPDKVRHFERARPNQLRQTDLFTFVLKRQNRRVYLVAFMDDHSRFLVGYGLHASQCSALVLEVLRAALTNFGTPEEILTDNGSQDVTWRGQSAFTKELERGGVAAAGAAGPGAARADLSGRCRGRRARGRRGAERAGDEPPGRGAAALAGGLAGRARR